MTAPDLPDDANPPDRIEVVIQPDPPPRLDKALARDVPEGAGLSRSRLMKLIEGGDVLRDGVPLTSPKQKVTPGEVLEIALGPAEDVEIRPQNIPLDVMYEDDALIVVNKPAGMVVHPAPGSPDGTLVNALLHHCGDSLSGIGGEKRPGIVHRIDKETSGLLVVAKSDIAHQGLAAQFANHSVEREYRALVYGVPDPGDPRLAGQSCVQFEAGGVICIRTAIGRHKTDRQKMAVVGSGGRHAVTRARVDDTFGTPPVLSLITCWLETGRTHQIRVHLSHVGHGLVGDPVYGGRRKLPKGAVSPAAMAAIADFPRQALHAATLGFLHPVSGENLRFASNLPDDLAGLLGAIDT